MRYIQWLGLAITLISVPGIPEYLSTWGSWFNSAWSWLQSRQYPILFFFGFSLIVVPEIIRRLPPFSRSKRSPLFTPSNHPYLFPNTGKFFSRIPQILSLPPQAIPFSNIEKLWLVPIELRRAWPWHHDLIKNSTIRLFYKGISASGPGISLQWWSPDKPEGDNEIDLRTGTVYQVPIVCRGVQGDVFKFHLDGKGNIMNQEYLLKGGGVLRLPSSTQTLMRIEIWSPENRFKSGDVFLLDVPPGSESNHLFRLVLAHPAFFISPPPPPPGP